MRARWEAVGADGIRRLYAFLPLRDGSEIDAYMSVGTPGQKLPYAEADRLLVRNLTWLGLVTVLAFAAAWFGGDIFLLRRVDALLGVTRRLAAGDLSVRAGQPYSRSELGHLAHAFDDMAAALEQHEAERKRMEETLHVSEKRFCSLIENGSEADCPVRRRWDHSVRQCFHHSSLRLYA